MYRAPNDIVSNALSNFSKICFLCLGSARGPSTFTGVGYQDVVMHKVLD